ncbi:hypothetical protein COY16_03425 [Candidatus Roizmanbacteria bacterium CG_4_10_14_0_2_um_filter_39_13]|uniref:IMP dehydrogenase/GMP reductase domain-containing protein n=1 Tax=Candidatus Roizmanbacteria bacterium CG_4_10_14_0_2_um_filter_39_13 TaxID=1974825 RepID=A0A2M7TYC3_9BACT|nr:MAG: hypothetical protein COY16_03425 [Candidatus Roizmanbacteria bacterium CG_4_10_14_0_2_um_filter_39_13]
MTRSIERWLGVADRLPKFEPIPARSSLERADIRPDLHAARRVRESYIPEQGISIAQALYNRQASFLSGDQPQAYYLDPRQFSTNAKNEILLISLDPKTVAPEIVLSPEEWQQVELDEFGLPKLYLLPKEIQHQAFLDSAEYLGKMVCDETIENVRKVQEDIDGNNYPEYSIRSHDFMEDVVGDQGEEVRERADGALEKSWTKNNTWNDMRANRQGFPHEATSRKAPRKNGIIGKMGRYARSMVEIVDMATGANTVQSIAYGAITGHRTTITRSGFFIEPKNQVTLAREVFSLIDSLDLSGLKKENQEFARQFFKNNIALAVGPNLDDETKNQISEFISLGGRSLTIHTIAPDKKILETAKELRKEFGDDMEIAAGVVPDVPYAEELAEHVDIIKFGHGPGTRCDSANANTLLQNAMEQVIKAKASEKLRGITVVAHLGSDDNASIPIYLGAGVGFVRAATGACAEKSLVYLRDYAGNYVLPNSGDASEPTCFVETAMRPDLIEKRYNNAGRMEDPEGVIGATRFSPESSSMGRRLGDIDRIIGNMLMNLGVTSVGQLYIMLANRSVDILGTESDAARNSSKSKNGVH